MRRFHCNIVKPGPVPGDTIPEREMNHLRKVLRATLGDRVILMDGRGTLGEAVLGSDGGLVVENVSRVPRPRLRLHLFSAAPAKSALDYMLRQCAEVGVWSVHLMSTERSVANPGGKTALERMRRIVIEGCKQSGNPWFPEIEDQTIPFDKAMDRIRGMDQAFFGATRGHGRTKTPPLTVTDEIEVAWIVGPEGGFTDTEEKLLMEAGVIPISLGPWTLRIETAAVIGAHSILSSAPTSKLPK